MNFDFGEVLTRAGQITWKHKVLWLLNLLPMVVVFLIFPIVFVFIFYAEKNPHGFTGISSNPIFVVLIILFELMLVLGSWILSAIARSATTVGVLRAEEGNPAVSFTELLRDGLPYFWRLFGVMLLISLTIGLAFFAIFGCIMAFSLMTMGMGAICVQPLMLLMMPVSLLTMALMEQAEAAVIADNKSVMDAIKYALDLVKAHVWKYVLITLILYFGTMLISSVIMVPLMVPFMGLSFIGFSSNEPFGSSMWMMGLFMLIFIPIMAFVQGIIATFMKSALTVTYLRLTRSTPLPTSVDA
ncbi:MAG: hypothetical protein IPP66_04030 [Anaerolineales bacterium]|nr:hypothetical protein [Anaerolineales bacterium]